MAGTAAAAEADRSADDAPEEPLFKLGSRRDAASDDEGSEGEEEGEIATVSAEGQAAAADRASEDGFHSAGEDEQDVPDWGAAPAAADGSEDPEVLPVELHPQPPQKREPFDVPTAGPYFMHDDRFEGDDEEEQLAKLQAAQKAQAAQPVKKWGHDLYEEVQRRIELGIPGPVASGGASGGRPRRGRRGGGYSGGTGDPLADDQYYQDQQQQVQERSRATFQEVGQQFQQFRSQQNHGGGRFRGGRRGRGGRGREGGHGQLPSTRLKADAASFQPRDSYQAASQPQDGGGWGEAPAQEAGNGWDAPQDAGNHPGSYPAASPYELEGHMAGLSVGQTEGESGPPARAGGGRRYSAMAGALA